jgi:hypothetical protein
MHVEERGGLSQIQRVHDSVESRISSPLFPQPQGIAGTTRPRGVVEASVLESSAWTRIHTRNVASTAVAVP